jgi:SPX domain protein involved in polyphosphate accumulation
MSQDHSIMASRYELKFIIPQRVALQIRQFVRQHLELDEFGQGQPDSSYPVHSLYFDSDDWKIYWRTMNGDKNRYKLRLRYYSDDPATPIFVEIKRRMKDIILKQRGRIEHTAVPELIAGHFPKGPQLRSADEAHAIEQFLQLMLNVQAKPKLHIAYEREAYVNDHNNEVRVTFDRNVRAVTRFDGKICTEMSRPIICTRDQVILELKFTNRAPFWYRDLVQTFNCFQTGAAKFVESTNLYLGRDLPERDMIRNMVL